jgi:hypothetical protein
MPRLGAPQFWVFFSVAVGLKYDTMCAAQDDTVLFEATPQTRRAAQVSTTLLLRSRFGGPGALVFLHRRSFRRCAVCRFFLTRAVASKASSAPPCLSRPPAACPLLLSIPVPASLLPTHLLSRIPAGLPHFPLSFLSYPATASLSANAVH